MKNFIKLAIYLVVVALLGSCQNTDGLDPTAGDPLQSSVMMEMDLHQTTLDYFAAPNGNEFSGLAGASSGDQATRMRLLPGQSPALQQGDTVYSYQEIPLIRETKTRFLIYEDGKSEMILEDITPDGINPLYSLTETPPGDDMLLSRTHIKDGRLRVYDKNNRLMVDEAYPEDNMKAFADSLLRILSGSEGSLKISAIQSPLPQGVVRTGLPDGKVQIEQLLGSMPSSVNAIPGSAQVKAVALMNEEMNRTLKFEIYSGNQLIHRKSFEYDDSYLLRNYVNGKEISSNPSSTESETLQISGDGLPVVYTTKTLYHRNQIRFTGKREGMEQLK